jgi:hypothetical protein
MWLEQKPGGDRSWVRNMPRTWYPEVKPGQKAQILDQRIRVVTETIRQEL